MSKPRDKEQTMFKNGDFRGSLWENPNVEGWLWEVERFDTDYIQPWRRAADGAAVNKEAALAAIERAKRVLRHKPIKV